MNRIALLSFAMLVALLILPAMAQAALQIISFTCNNMAPTANTETGASMNCEAVVQNTDSQNSVSMSSVKLYTTGGWSSAESYTGSDFSNSISAGGTTTARFSSIVANVPGGHKFLNVDIDASPHTEEVTDITVNSMTFKALAVTTSASSATSGAEFSVNAYLTAGGSISSASMTIGLSGGCSLSSGESAAKSIGSMSNNVEASKSWKVTQGSSSACSITVSASGTSSPVTIARSGTASVSCSGCGGGGDGGSGTGGGGSSGAGTGRTTHSIGAVSAAGASAEVSGNDIVRLSVNGAEHTITVLELTNTQVKLEVRSSSFNTTLSVGEIRKIDIDEDGRVFDLSITLNSINTTSKKANLTFRAISENIPAGAGVIPTGGVCEPNIKKCVGNELHTCRTDGLAWGVTECGLGCDQTALRCMEESAAGPATGDEEAGDESPPSIALLAASLAALILAVFAGLYCRKAGAGSGRRKYAVVLAVILVIAAVLLASASMYIKPVQISQTGYIIGTVDLVGCLAENGAVLYGASWCGECREQNALFGGSFSRLNYVDCKTSYDQCIYDGIREIPAWKIGGSLYGYLSLERLAEIAGC